MVNQDNLNLAELQGGNGLEGAGISVGVSIHLSECAKLQVDPNPNAGVESHLNQSYQTLINWYALPNLAAAVNKLSTSVAKGSLEKLIFTVAYRISEAKLASNESRYVTRKKSSLALTQEAVNTAVSVIAQYSRIAWNLIIATKMSFLATAHHIGQGSLTPIVSKAAFTDSIFTEQDIEGIKGALHHIAHWASLEQFCLWFGYSGIKPEINLVPALQSAAVPAGFDIRRDQAVAGTARINFAREAVRRLDVHPLLAVFPSLDALIAIKQTWAEVIKNPLAYHVNSEIFKSFISQTVAEPRKINEVPMLGALATFVTTIHNTSTLAKSKILPSRSAHKDLPGYSAIFDRHCCEYAELIASSVATLPKAIVYESTPEHSRAVLAQYRESVVSSEVVREENRNRPADNAAVHNNNEDSAIDASSVTSNSGSDHEDRDLGEDVTPLQSSLGDQHATSPAATGAVQAKGKNKPKSTGKVRKRKPRT